MRSRWFGPRTRAGWLAATLGVALIGPAITVPGRAVAAPEHEQEPAALVAGCETFGFRTGPVTPGAGDPRDVEVADTNQNGFDDLLIADAAGEGDVRQLVAVGDGSFRTAVGPGAPPEVYPVSGRPRNISVGHLNRDAEPDFAVATTDGVGIWFGAAGSDPGFGPGGGVLRGKSVADVALADVDRDLLPDLAAVDPQFADDPTDDELVVLRNLNGGAFDTRFELGRQDTYIEPTFLAGGDLTGNGVPDFLVSSHHDSELAVIRNGVRSPAPTIKGLGETWKPAIADFDLDGQLDTAVAFLGEDRIRLWSGFYDPRGTGSSPVPPVRELPAVDLGPLTPGREAPHDVDVADLNRDGRPDLVVVGYQSRAVYVFPGTGDGTFGHPAVLSAGSRPVQAAVGRFDNNQSLDVVVLDDVDGTVRTYLNDCAAPGPDLTVSGMEVTQVVQDLGNSVDLIADRRTVVRAYVGTTAPTAAVTARLHGVRPDGSAAGPPVEAANPGRTVVPDPAPKRGQLAGGFLFDLPTSWTAEGELTLRVEVNPDRRVSEPSYENNLRSQTVRFQPSNPVRIELVRFGFQRDGTWVLPPESRLDETESLLRRTLPTSRLEVTRSEFRDEHPYFWLRDDAYYPDGNDAESVLDRYRQLTAGERRPGVYYLLLVERDQMGGIAEGIPGWVAVNGPGPMTVLHELGHLLGASHVQCTPDPRDEDGARPYPYPGGTIGGPDLADPSFAGFDVGDASLRLPWRVVWPPDATPPTADVMSYCGSKWVSDDTWRIWRTRIQNTPPVAGATGDLLTLSGTIGGDGGATLTGRRIGSISQRPATTPGAYRLQLLDAGGATLAEHPFTPAPTTESHEMRSFSEVVDFVPGTRRVALVDTVAREELASLAVSAHAPTVAFTGPGLPDSVPADGPVTVGWTAGDPDGGQVTADVLYSPDGADDWRVLATGLTGGAHTLDAGLLPGTGGAATGRLRIRASDGVHTAETTSGPLTVAGKAPRVRITAPLGGSFHTPGQTVTLAATAVDLEQGDLAGAALHWTSSLDGDLGTGGTVTPGQLSEGRHTVTVTATDADGGRATAQTEVTIGRTVPAGSPPTAQAGPDRTAVEGDVVTLDATGSTDPDGDPVSLSWTVLAQPPTGEVGGVRLDGPVTAPSFRATQSGAYRLLLTASDGRHGTSTDTVTVTVANRAPELAALAVDHDLRVAGPVTVRTTFTDPGVLDGHTCAVDWDAGDPAPATSGTVTAHLGEGTCVAAGDLRPGVHETRLTLTDSDGGVAERRTRLVVYDPSDVTAAGNGSVVSPPGAYDGNLAATGPAEFAFVAGAVKGSPEPFGETRFRLAGEDLEFSGTTHERLTVSRTVAQYRGSGTVNGRSGYSYLLTVSDGADGRDADRFRIRIWESGSGRVLYDNRRGLPDDLDPAYLQPVDRGGVVVAG